MKTVITFGEIMLRLSPPGFERLFQSPLLAATFGGGEANVAVSLAHFGLDSRYVTRLPANAVGDAALRAVRAEGVNVDGVLRGGDRLGIYFAETGASQRAGVVVYDRAGSAVAGAGPGVFDWARLLSGAAWFRVTGITPALGPAAAATTLEAVEAARAAGARVSIDLNFRRKLWTEEEAQAVMRPLAARAHVVIANEEDVQACLGLAVRDTDVRRGGLDPAAYRETAVRVARDFGSELVRDHAPGEPVGKPERLERRPVGRGRGGLPRKPEIRRDPRRPDRRGRLVRRRPRLRARHRALPGGGARLRGRRQRPEADDPGGLQPRDGRRGRPPRGRRRERAGPAVAGDVRPGIPFHPPGFTPS